MAHNDPSVRQVRRHTERAARKASPWIERMARVGYVAYGIVYVLVGALAVQAAFGGSGKTTSQEGALRQVLLAPLGRILLAMIAIGLLAYATWRLFQGILDPENEGKGAKGFLKRVDHVLNGLFHAALAFSAGRLALGTGGGGGSPDDWTARLLAQPFGRWLAAIVGTVIVGAGLYQFYKAYKADFRDELESGSMSARERTWATRSGRLGYAARGVVFDVIGVFLIRAALQTDPDEARGLGGALETLARQPFGPYILGAVALGLVAYGAFMFVMARYRWIEPRSSF
ncbi:MAG TPA: DUF1206 domain-containing protein [Rubrobacteraceae bacterium]|nr:DUF1206 domain-containing protein [Rubrobacteraceae bacterium]